MADGLDRFSGTTDYMLRRSFIRSQHDICRTVKPIRPSSAIPSRVLHKRGFKKLVKKGLREFSALSTSARPLACRAPTASLRGSRVASRPGSAHLARAVRYLRGVNDAGARRRARNEIARSVSIVPAVVAAVSLSCGCATYGRLTAEKKPEGVQRARLDVSAILGRVRVAKIQSHPPSIRSSIFPSVSRLIRQFFL